MIGRISALDVPNLFGFIKAENGLSVRFEHSALMAYDVTGLTLDQLVSFDVENGPNPKAVNVCVRKEQQTRSVREEARRDHVRLRFMGFEQKGLNRDYRFDQVSVAGDAIRLNVTIAMSLFTKYHVGIQDGPALCLLVLNAESNPAGADFGLQREWSVTDGDVQRFADSKSAAAGTYHRNRQTKARQPAPPAAE
jgi:cold shock CspA family protein